ncbi:Thioredoxin-like fold protein [Actinidia chinensis var. chinensis]|uniref:Thioredoxin-like fold protein n=1 Tax=Actinidia chinensis var. chinensis TaxID=1590841 RepID=A0A2R6R1Q1_ACTCC|nr:Thioredoxin-like fold protein [Actinidia chinensis var. chinensis]
MFESTKSPTSVLDESQPESKSSKLLGPVDDSSIRLVDTEDRIVVYFTSLRGIRRTYEDCCAVRMILSGFRVMVDQRDISMDLEKELQSVLGEKNVNLPQVFIRGKYIGGAYAIKQ